MSRDPTPEQSEDAAPRRRRAAARVPAAAAVTGCVLAAAGGWVAAGHGEPVGASLAAAVAVLVVLAAPRTRTAGRRALAGEVVAVQAQMANLLASKEELSRQAAAATARAEATAELVIGLEESVRAAVMAELHDTVTQTLVAAAFATSDPSVTQEDLGDMMRTAESELRQVMLCEAPLKFPADLSTHVARLVDRYEDRSSFRVALTWSVEPDRVVTRPTAIAVYRFLAEGLRNALRHSGRMRASVEVCTEGDALIAAVTDEGDGFDLSTPREGRGLDLLRSRCAVVGGSVDVRTEPGAGTRLRLRVPLGPAGGPVERSTHAG